MFMSNRKILIDVVFKILNGEWVTQDLWSRKEKNRVEENFKKIYKLNNTLQLKRINNTILTADQWTILDREKAYSILKHTKKC